MRTIPADLQTHLNGASTTTTRLLKIKLKSGAVYGLAMIDRDVAYDDGTADGEVNYLATNGFDPSAIEADTGYTVSNAEGYALISAESDDGITLEMVKAGELDDATWVCYLVNWDDLAAGHMILDAGDVGEVRAQHGMVWIPELLSYGMRLAQPIGGVWSRTCRAVFGTAADSPTGCGVDISTLWVNDTVASVGGENNRIFSGATLGDSPGATIIAPARVQFLTGENAGREFAVEEMDGDEVTLSEPTPYAIAAGNSFRIRRDCGKRFTEDCVGVWNNGANFKGEPLIPTGDATALQAPGAQLPRAGGYVGRAAVFNEPDSG